MSVGYAIIRVSFGKQEIKMTQNETTTTGAKAEDLVKDAVIKPATKSRKELTKEESDFFKLIRLRATSNGVGQPYIASAIFRLTPISAPGLGTMGVDKFWRCYIDFDFMMEKGVEYAAGVLAHEPWHLLRDHNKRAENVGADKTPFLWNIAGDLEINDDIMDLVPKDSLFPGKGEFADFKPEQIAEVYYAQVKKIVEENQKTCQQCGKPKADQNGQQGQNGDQQGQGQSGNQEGSGEGSDGQNGEAGDQQGNGSGQGKSDDQQGQGQGGSGNSHSHGNEGETCSGHGNGTGLPNPNCGSGSGNTLEGYELAEGDAEAVDGDEHESIKKQIAEEIRRYARSNPGKVGGSAQVWAENVLAHKPVSWRQVLRGQLKSAIAYKRGHTDYVRKRPARRQPIKDVVMPALRSPVPRIGLAIDTSGSNLHKLGVIIDEISAMTKQVGVRGNDLVAFAVDTRKSGKLQKVTDPKKIDLTGGGGTDMRVAYTELAAISPKVDIGIILTDGETPWPEQAPSNNVKYITVIVVDSSRGWTQNIIDEAEKNVGRWSKIVVVDVDET